MVKIAAVQLTATDDIERTLRKASQLLEVAAHKGARIACFAELFASPWFPAERNDAHLALAEPLGGIVTSRMASLAAQYGLAVVCPFFERDAAGRYYNSAALFDARGETVGVYRKVHLPSLRFWEEKHYFTPGDKGFPVFEVEGLRVGIQICWDNFFPEGFRMLALAGAQAVFVPTGAAFASQERWMAMAVSHAVANGFYVVRVNRVGKEAGLDFYGQSFCIRPDGELASEPMGLNEGVLLVDCEPALVDEARRVWPFLRDRRPRQYAGLAGLAWPPACDASENEFAGGAVEEQE
jgi:N-carbamoylputrescine amidase